MDKRSILFSDNSRIHPFHNLTVRVMNSRVSGQCLYTILFTCKYKWRVYYTNTNIYESSRATLCISSIRTNI